MRNCLESSARKRIGSDVGGLDQPLLAIGGIGDHDHRPPRGALGIESLPASRASRLADFLDEHPDGAAAGQADIPGGLVGDAEFEHFGLAAGDHVERLGDHRALDAAAGHRAQEGAVIVDHEAGACRPRRRAPGLNHGGQRHAVAGLLPVLGRLQDVFVAIEHGSLFRSAVQAAGRIRLR